MDRSTGFGSTQRYSIALFRLAFATPPARSLKLATQRKSLTHYTKGTPSLENRSPSSDCLYACGFRFYFTPLPGFFSPFPHGTGSLSVDDEYLALEDGPPIFRQDFTCPALLVSSSVPRTSFRIRGYHPLRPPFPERFANSRAKSRRLVPFRSPLLRESRLISVPLVTEMFQFSRFAPRPLCIQERVTSKRPGFPIRKSADQGPFAGSPQLIAGCRVLRRLSSPRHPPHALIRLTL